MLKTEKRFFISLSGMSLAKEEEAGGNGLNQSHADKLKPLPG